MYSKEDRCECCPHGYHIHLDFVQFAKEQLCVQKSSNLEIKTSANNLVVREKSKNFEVISNEPNSKEYIESKRKPMKRESAFIHQKILDLQTRAPRTSEEIYGRGLLEAVEEFEDFIGKNWGRRSQLKRKKKNAALMLKNDENLQEKQNSNYSSPRSGLHLTDSFTPVSSVNDKLSWHVEGISNKIGNAEKIEHHEGVCILCQRKCLYKENLLIDSEHKLAPKLSKESISKGVNTELVDDPDTRIETDAIESITGGRSVQLSNQAIETTRMTERNSEGEGKTNNESKGAMNGHRTKGVMNNESMDVGSNIEETMEAAVLEIQENLPNYPTDDMKEALKIVNDALLYGRTGREVSASMVVMLNEWFKIVGSTNACADVVSNYLNVLASYSPQLLRYVVNIPDTSGITALHYAVSYGNYPVVLKLLDTNVVDPNKLNKSGYTSIMLASVMEIMNEEQENVIRKLIALSDVNIKAAQHSQTALMLAASHGRFKITQLLLEAGAEVNAQDEDGSTALMCAVEHGHVDIVQCLLAQPDCDPHITDNDGFTALNVAMAADQKDIAVMLYAHMHFVQNVLSSSRTPTRLLPNRSRSTTNNMSPHRSIRTNSVSLNEQRSVAKKQQSSIN